MTLRAVRTILATFSTCRMPSPSVESSGSRSGSSRNLATAIASSSPGSPEVSLQKQVATFSSLVAHEAQENAWQVLGSRWRQRAGVYSQGASHADDADRVRRFSSRSSTTSSSSVSFRQPPPERGPHPELSRKRSLNFSQSCRSLGSRPPSCSRSMTALPVQDWGDTPLGTLSVGVQFPTPPRLHLAPRGTPELPALALQAMPKADASAGAAKASASPPKIGASAEIARAQRSSKIDAFFMEEFQRLDGRLSPRASPDESGTSPGSSPDSLESCHSSLRPGSAGFPSSLGTSHGLMYTDAAHLVLEHSRKRK